LLRWVREGAPGDLADPVRLVGVRVYPENIIARAGAQQQLQVRASYSDGSVRDVTRLGGDAPHRAPGAPRTQAGVAPRPDPGETAVVVRFERMFAVSSVIVLGRTHAFAAAVPPKDNLVDRHVVAKLNDLKIGPSEGCDDAEFLRRVFIDLIGLQPT